MCRSASQYGHLFFYKKALSFSPVVRNLGVTLDLELTFATHIRRLCGDSYCHLRQLRIVVRWLTSDATATLIHAFITA